MGGFKKEVSAVAHWVRKVGPQQRDAAEKEVLRSATIPRDLFSVARLLLVSVEFFFSVTLRTSWSLAFLTFAFASVALGDSLQPPAQRRDDRVTARELAQGFRNRTLIAKPRSGVTTSELAVDESGHGTQLRRAFKRFGDLRVLEVSPNQNVEDAIRQLRATGLYDYVEPDYIKTQHAVPDDSRFGEQWYLRNTGQSSGTAGADIGAVTAWDTRSSAPDVIVAIIDTGIRATHEDLAANLWHNPGEIPGNGIDDDGDGYIDDVYGINSLVPLGSPNSGKPDDDAGHGTSVASVIAAAGNNGKGMTGVAWQAKIMALKFDDATGASTISNEIECFDYAVAKGAKIINVSYGSTSFSQAEYDAIKRARDAGVILVSSAGNDGASNDLVASYPASYLLENVVAVANTDRNDLLASSSTYGSLVELGAPGSAILTCSYKSDTEYRVVDGTSFSSPLVAGSLALMRAQFPADTYRGLINRVLRSVDPLASLAGKVQTGGRLNLAKALTSTSSRPFNDDFANRAQLTGDSSATRNVSTGATSEPGEPTHGAAGGASLWWTWTAPRSGTVVLDTAGSNFDTTTAVYTGAAVNALTLVASNDNAPGLTTSHLSFAASSGTSYQIAVDGKGGATGMISLSVGLLPANDNFANAAAITGVSIRTTGTNKLASREAGEPTLVVSPSTGRGNTVWYRWNAPRTSMFTICAFTETFGPILGVYTGNSVGLLTKIDADLDSVSFTASSGSTYYFAVDSVDAGSGTFTFTLLEAGFAITFGSPVTPSPAVGADGALVLTDSRSEIYYFKSSSSNWLDHLGGNIDVNTPALSPAGTIYVATSTGLYALDPSHITKWSKTYADGTTSSPTIAADGTVYVHTGDGYLYAYLTDGTQKWRASVPGISYSSPSVASDGTIYIGSDDHNVYALSPIDGSVKWKFNAGAEVYSSVAIATDGTLYVGTLSTQFFAISPTGGQVWVFQAGGNVSSSAAIAPDGTIYFGCYDGKLYALNPNSTLKWTYTTGDEIRASSPAVGSDGTIYIGSYDQSLHAVTPAGILKQTYPTGGAIRSSPVINDGLLMVGSGDNRVYGINVAAGVSSSPWPMHRQNSSRTGRRAGAGLPVIRAQPSSRTIAIGGSATLSVVADGQDPLSYQWNFNGAPIAGATQSTYTISNASASVVGNYTVVITNSLGSVTSSASTINVAAASDVGRIINLSARAIAGAGDKTLIVGFAVSGGSGSKPLLIRGVGPTLANFSVSGYLVDPSVTLFDVGGASIGTNDNWGTDPLVAGLLSQVGAFSFISATSKDAAMIASVVGGIYTAKITSSTSAPNDSGVALAEFYDASDVYTSGTPRLVNISARAQVGMNGDVLIVGFIIGGSTPVRVLIRGIGPELGQYGVTGLLADPKMTLRTLPGQVVVQENDDWGTAVNLAEIQAAMSSSGAFPIPANSKSAVIVVTLQPGAYTAVISGVNNTTGVALAEVYELP